jgi:hypothetical protein
VGSYGHVLLCQAINDAASRGPGTGEAYLVVKAPRRGDWMPRPVLS